MTTTFRRTVSDATQRCAPWHVRTKISRDRGVTDPRVPQRSCIFPVIYRSSPHAGDHDPTERYHRPQAIPADARAFLAAIPHASAGAMSSCVTLALRAAPALLQVIEQRDDAVGRRFRHDVGD